MPSTLISRCLHASARHRTCNEKARRCTHHVKSDLSLPTPHRYSTGSKIRVVFSLLFIGCHE